MKTVVQAEDDPYKVAKEMKIYKEIESPSTLKVCIEISNKF